MLLLFSHLFGRVLIQVVQANEMEHTMDDIEQEFVINRCVPFGGNAGGGVDADDDFAFESQIIFEDKANHIRRPIVLQMSTINSLLNFRPLTMAQLTSPASKP